MTKEKLESIKEALEDMIKISEPITQEQDKQVKRAEEALKLLEELQEEMEATTDNYSEVKKRAGIKMFSEIRNKGVR